MQTKLSLLVVLALVGSPCLGQYLVNQDGTRGGNSPGRACVFPFIYKGQSHETCITNDFGKVPWCATTDNYDNLQQWSRCEITIVANRTRNGNAGRSTCSLPFTYKGNTYDKCVTRDNPSNKPWCATSPSYERDSQWAECVRYPDIKTIAGNVPNGSACNFPFWYQGDRIHGCINSNNNGIGWCATTSSYDRDNAWGNCVVTTLGSSNSECPDGNTYEMVSGTLSYGGTGKANADTVEKCQAECDMEPSCIGFDFDNNPGVDARCYIHTNQGNFGQKETGDGVVSVDQYTLTNRCTNEGGSQGGGEETGQPVRTKGGNAGPNGQCAFPFRYEGRSYNSCTSQKWYTPWCGTTSNFDEDGEWGDCANIPTS